MAVLLRTLGMALLFCAGVWTTEVQADVSEEAPSEVDSSSQLTVFWMSSGAPGDSEGIEALRSQLSDLSLEFRVLEVKDLGTMSTSTLMRRLEEQLQAENHSGAHYIVCWLEGENPKRFVGVVRGESERVLLRPVEVDVESSDDTFVQAQTIALMVRTTVQAILEGGTLGIAMPNRISSGAAQPSSEEPSLEKTREIEGPVKSKEGSSAENSASDREEIEEMDSGEEAHANESRWAFSLFYQGRVLSQDHPWINGGGATVDLRVWKGLWFGVEARAFQAAKVESERLVVRVQHFPIDAWLAYRWKPFGQSSAWTFGGRAGAWVAPLLRESFDVDAADGRSASDKRRAVEAGAQAAVEIAYRLRPKFDLFVAAGMDAVVQHFQVTERVDGEGHVIFRPWSLRPKLSVGIVFGR